MSAPKKLPFRSGSLVRYKASLGFGILSSPREKDGCVRIFWAEGGFGPWVDPDALVLCSINVEVF